MFPTEQSQAINRPMKLYPPSPGYLFLHLDGSAAPVGGWVVVQVKDYV